MRLKNLVKVGFLGLSIVLITALGWYAASAQTQGNRVYYSETGHYVEGEFLNFYLSQPNPELVFGYPITEAFRDPTTGVQFQYFQRARFELHETISGSTRVQLTPLGQYLYQPEQPFPLEKNPSLCRTFENGIDVCYSFLRFFDEHGGIEQFGLPISEVEFHQNRLVQYFERARLEWHPENAAAGQAVKLSDLGMLYFYEIGEDTTLLRSLLPSGVLRNIIRLHVRAFTTRAVVSEGIPQSIFVIVLDQNLNPVSQTQVRILVQFPTGETESYLLSPTNDFGFTSGVIPFEVGESQLGFVEIEVIAVFENFEERTLTSFRISK